MTQKKSPRMIRETTWKLLQKKRKLERQAAKKVIKFGAVYDEADR